MMRKISTHLLFPALIFLGISEAFAQTRKSDTLSVGDAAPAFFLRTLQGEEFFLSDYCGKPRQPWKSSKQYVVILSFFATWCQPCLKEIPELEEAAATYAGKDLKVFLIDVNEKAEVVGPFVKKHGFKLPVLLDVYGIVTKKYGATKLPRYFLIDKSGKIELMGEGYSAAFKETLNANLPRLLGSNP